MYGFTYDDEVVTNAGGEIWPGASLAEEAFQNRAERGQIDVIELRRRMRDLYHAQLSGQNAARRAVGEEDTNANGDKSGDGAGQSFENELAGNES
jgi:hypothetical protein